MYQVQDEMPKKSEQKKPARETVTANEEDSDYQDKIRYARNQDREEPRRQKRTSSRPGDKYRSNSKERTKQAQQFRI